MTITLSTMRYGFLLLLMLSAVGCACHSGSACKHGSSWCTNPGNPCHGYYSTCWREWPCECERCPPYTLGLLEGAVLLNQGVQEPLPPGQPQPMLSEPPSAPPPQTQHPSVPHRPAGKLEKPLGEAAMPMMEHSGLGLQPEIAPGAEHMLVSAEQPLPSQNELRDERPLPRVGAKPMFSSATFKAAP